VAIFEKAYSLSRETIKEKRVPDEISNLINQLNNIGIQYQPLVKVAKLQEYGESPTQA